ncbi:hypothetical protein [Streptomyces lavendulae]
MSGTEVDLKDMITKLAADFGPDPLPAEEVRELLNQTMSAFMGMYEETSREYFADAVARADKDGDGMVSGEDLKQVLLAVL